MARKKKTILSRYDFDALNMGKKIKLRYRARKNGIYLYLDYWNGVSRNYLSLDLIIQNHEDTFITDENSLLNALDIRDRKEKERINNPNFTLKHISSSISFFDYFESLSKKRDKNYRNTFLYLKKYSKDIAIDNVNNRYLSKFIDFLNEQNLSQNTVWVYVAKFKAVMNEAVRDEILKFNPITISAKKGETERQFLTLEEIKLFQAVEVPYCEETKQAFLFSCFTGLRISDVRNLKFKDVQENFLVFQQQKTKTYERLPLSETASKIIINQKKKHKKGFVFKLVLTPTAITNHLKKILEQAGIQKYITFHCARHTFATLNLTMGNDIYSVSKLLGHKDLKTTQIYAKLIDEKLKSAVNKLPIL